MRHARSRWPLLVVIRAGCPRTIRCNTSPARSAHQAGPASDSLYGGSRLATDARDTGSMLRPAPETAGNSACTQDHSPTAQKLRRHGYRRVTFRPPQGNVNRKGTLARGAGDGQPNNSLDSCPAQTNRRGRGLHATGAGEWPRGDRRTGKKKAHPAGVRLRLTGSVRGRDQALSALMRFDRRDILRATVFLCSTPLLTPRSSSGWAACSAVFAAPASPEAMASSTRRRKVRMRERRALLISNRRSFWRARFWDWGVLAMGLSIFRVNYDSVAQKPRTRPVDRRIDSCLSGPTRMWRQPIRQSRREGKPKTAQRSRNCGSRFSRKAPMPSFWSSVAKSAWKTRRSNRRPSRSVVS